MTILESTTPLLVISRLTKMFGNYRAVQDLSLELGPGSAVALWGPNGAGKTTVIRCLLGLLDYQGSIRLGGHCAARRGKQARALLGYVPQELNFQDDLTVAQTLKYFAALKGASAPLEALERVGLSQNSTQRVGSLSGGMKQRLALALALLGDPPLLLLDEPTSNLDLRGRGEFLHLLTELRQAGKSLLFSSHRLEEVLTLADRVVVLERGEVCSLCTPSELVESCGRQVLGEVGPCAWKTSIKLLMAPQALELALSTLQAEGFSASRNGTCVWVTVATNAKAAPIQTLAQAGISVSDFEIQ